MATMLIYIEKGCIILPLKLHEYVYCTLNAQLGLYEVVSIIKRGKPPRYELRNLLDNRAVITSLPMDQEEEWFGKYIFIEPSDAKSDLDRRIHDEITKWSDRMFQGKEQLTQYLFDLWLSIDAAESFSKMGHQNQKIREHKIKLFADKIEEYFGVKVVTPSISKKV